MMQLNIYEFIFQTPISVDTNRVYIIYMDSSIFLFVKNRRTPGKLQEEKEDEKKREAIKKYTRSSESLQVLLFQSHLHLVV
jgi:hypothetical protein